jgi:DNA-binding MarR family transcriptional regulator
MSKRTVSVLGRNARKSCGWREALLDYAESAWSDPGTASAACHKAPSKLQADLESSLGPLARHAAVTVARYVGGARLAAGDNGTAMLPHDVQCGVDLILRGVATKLADQDFSVAAENSPLVIQFELWQLLRKVRESGELSFARMINLIDLDRRILMFLHNRGPSVPADIANSVGVDKAQVSRSVKRLLELNMISREQIRLPLRLTRKGEANINMLLERAVVLYEQERDLALGSGKSSRSEEPVVHGGSIAPIDRTRIIFPLLTLSSYFGRSGALAFKRLTGLSKFEAFVLRAIASRPPIDWGELVANLRRDHSQAGRTVTALMERGLIRREGKPGRRHGSFYPTAKGEQLDKVVRQASRERSSYLLAPLSEEQRERFFATLAKIRRNARSQLEREKAIEELNRADGPQS